jgi:cobalt-zinc-cadmium resistance protein CzcA
VIRVTVRHAGWTAVLVASLVLGALYFGTRLGTEFLPRLILILVSMLGLLPTALATGIGSDIQRPLATVVGGLLSTLFLTLLALPAVYWLASRRRQQAALEVTVGERS